MLQADRSGRPPTTDAHRSRLQVVPRPEMHLEMRGYVDDDPGYSCAVMVSEGRRTDDHWEWVELFLENVNERAQGEERVANARVIVRLWFGETHLDFPYSDAVLQLEKAKSLLIGGETKVPPE